MFGVATLHPDTIGQNIPMIAKVVDYIAPMVYPSLWSAGMLRVPDPVHDPYTIVTRSLEEFTKQTKGTKTKALIGLAVLLAAAAYAQGTSTPVTFAQYAEIMRNLRA